MLAVQFLEVIGSVTRHWKISVGSFVPRQIKASIYLDLDV
jgi:hypothetical protein